MTDGEKLQLRVLHALVSDETDSARLKFQAGPTVETLPAAYGMVALVEEVGKLSRCYNKLVIATEPRIVRQWLSEASHRQLTCLSLLERMYLKARRTP